VLSALIQDDITLKPNKVRLTLGSKFEHNSYTGFEIQPNIRVLWTPKENRTIWASISRAVRTPSRWERSGRVNCDVLPGPMMIVVLPDTDFSSETVLAHEVGYRTQPSKNISVDVAAFYNVYRDVRAFVGLDPYLEMSPSPPHYVLPLQLQTALPGWLPERVLDPMDGSPKTSYHIRSFMDLPGNLEFDVMLYVVGFVKRTNVVSYARLDLRLGWRPKPDLDVSLIVQNALKAKHNEFDTGLDEKETMQQRSVFLKVTKEY